MDPFEVDMVCINTLACEFVILSCARTLSSLRGVSFASGRMASLMRGSLAQC